MEDLGPVERGMEMGTGGEIPGADRKEVGKTTPA
jgi:hypothetical protein